MTKRSIDTVVNMQEWDFLQGNTSFKFRRLETFSGDIDDGENYVDNNNAEWIFRGLADENGWVDYTDENNWVYIGNPDEADRDHNYGRWHGFDIDIAAFENPHNNIAEAGMDIDIVKDDDI